MAAEESLSLEQFDSLIAFHGGTAFPHYEKGGVEIMLSQRLGERWGMDNRHWLPSLDMNHPVVAKVIEESKKEGLL